MTDHMDAHLVGGKDVSQDITKDKSPQTDGGSASYYQFEIPQWMLDSWNKTGKIEVRHVCRIMLKNDFDKSNIFKALVRLGNKDGVEVSYDINKIHFFTDCIEEALQ